MSTPELRTRTERGCVIVTMPDGSKWTHERTITSYDDWWDTPLGKINFGRAIWGPLRLVKLEP